MTSVEDAWEWYAAIRRTLRRAAALGAHWDHLPWDGPVGRDNRLQGVEADKFRSDAADAGGPLDDLAVVVLFSLFEAEVRGCVLAAIEPEVAGLRHPVLVDAAANLRDVVSEGSFFRLLSALKLQADKALIEEVNQVRHYRNWVAHGRRSDRPPAVAPVVAFERLKRFLQELGLRPQVAPPPPGTA